MKIIGIDPGTKCGWAIIDRGNRIASGVWDLKPRRHEGGGMRYLRARRLFEQLVKDSGVDAVGYEEVRRHQGVDAAHIYGGIVGQITAICEDLKIPFKALPVGTVKKTATGKGNASKDLMIKAAENQWQHTVADDNEADALWIAQTLYEQLK